MASATWCCRWFGKIGDIVLTLGGFVRSSVIEGKKKLTTNPMLDIRDLVGFLATGIS
jgi:hypothetical protein